MKTIQLPQVYGQRVIRALEKAGFIVRRQKGNHAVHTHQKDLTSRVVVPLHGSTPVKPGTLRSILEGAAISIEDFKNFLK